MKLPPFHDVETFLVRVAALILLIMGIAHLLIVEFERLFNR